MGSPNDLKPGIKLGLPEAQLCYVGALPMRKLQYIEKINRIKYVTLDQTNIYVIGVTVSSLSEH